MKTCLVSILLATAVTQARASLSDTWLSGAGHTAQMAPSVPDGNEIFTVRSLLPTSQHPRQFMRVRAESIPLNP